MGYKIKKEIIRSSIILLISYIFFNLYYMLVFLIDYNVNQLHKVPNIISGVILFSLIFIIIPFTLNRIIVKKAVSEKNKKSILTIIKVIIIVQIISITATFHINSDFPELLTKKELILSYINKYTLFFLINSLFLIINIKTS